MAVAVAVGLLSGDSGSDDAFVFQVVEDAALLVVAGLFRHEVVEAGNVVERWDGAAPVAGNAVDRMTDQKGKVKLLEDLFGDDGRVVWLGDGWVRIRCGGGGIGGIVDGMSIEDRNRLFDWRDNGLERVFTWNDLLLRRGLGTNTALWLLQRRGDGGRASIRRNEVVGDVLDEDLLVFLLVGK